MPTVSGAASCSCIMVEPRDGVGPRLVDPLVRGVVVDGVGDQQHGAVGVVEHGEVGRQQEADVGHAQLVGVVVGHPLPRADGVVGQVADQAAGQRGQARQRRRAQQVDRVAQGGDGTAAVVHATRRAPQPHRLAVALGEHGRAAHADERVPRPVAALLGRLQQERAGPVAAQRLEQADRRDAVGQQPPDDRDDAAVAGERAEGLEVGCHGTGEVASCRPPSQDRRRRRSRCGPRCGRPRRPGRRAAARCRRRSPGAPRAPTGRARTCRPWPSARRGCG